MRIKYLFIIFFLASSSVSAQMFSVRGGTGEPRIASNTFFRIGYAPAEFIYKGQRSPIVDLSRLDFSSQILLVGLESPGLNASLAFANNLSGADDERYLQLAIDYTNRISFVRTRRIQLGVPVSLITSVTSVRNETNNNEFNQSVFKVGGGVFSSIRLGNKIGLGLEALPSYGFANSSGGLFGGTNWGAEGKGRINFLNLFPGRTLSIGYDYKFSSFDVDGEELDYDLSYHLITIGISL